MAGPIFLELYDKDEDIVERVNLSRVDAYHAKPEDSFDYGRCYVKIVLTVHGRIYSGYVRQETLQRINGMFGFGSSFNNALEALFLGERKQ